MHNTIQIDAIIPGGNIILNGRNLYSEVIAKLASKCASI